MTYSSFPSRRPAPKPLGLKKINRSMIFRSKIKNSKKSAWEEDVKRLRKGCDQSESPPKAGFPRRVVC
jgi:hypothetical protein